MVKINLLPPYVVERRKVRGFWKWPLLIIILEVLLSALLVRYMAAKESELNDTLQTKQTEAAKVPQIEAEISAANASAAPDRAKVDWYKNILNTNAKIADTLTKVNAYIYAGMSVKQMQITGANVTIQAATKYDKNLKNLSTCYLNLLRSPYIVQGSQTLSPAIPSGTTTAAIPGAGGAGPGGPTMGPMGGMGPMTGGRAMMGSMGPMTGGREMMGSMGPMTGGQPMGASAPAAENPNENLPVTFTFVLESKYALGGAAGQAGATAGGGGMNVNPMMGGGMLLGGGR